MNLTVVVLCKRKMKNAKILLSKRDIGVKLKCKRCGKRWTYTGKKEVWCSCPNCGCGIKISEHKIDDIKTVYRILIRDEKDGYIEQIVTKAKFYDEINKRRKANKNAGYNAVKIIEIINVGER